MIFWYVHFVMSNARNAYGIMQILIIKHQLVKEIAKRYRVFNNLRKLIHPAQLNIIFIKIWKLKFHGILSHFKTQCIDDTNGSITNNSFHGIPWNWHQQLHGIPWNLECANFDDTSNSMEFHGTSSAQISMKRAVPWNSMEFHGTSSALISLTWAVPWNSMKFHGTWIAPISMGCTMEYANFADMSSSMEFHGTSSAPISLTQAVPWNSMEFHGTSSAPISLT